MSPATRPPSWPGSHETSGAAERFAGLLAEEGVPAIPWGKNTWQCLSPLGAFARRGLPGQGRLAFCAPRRPGRVRPGRVAPDRRPPVPLPELADNAGLGRGETKANDRGGEPRRRGSVRTMALHVIIPGPLRVQPLSGQAPGDHRGQAYDPARHGAGLPGQGGGHRGRGHR